jgi:hypothetical protein
MIIEAPSRKYLTVHLTIEVSITWSFTMPSNSFKYIVGDYADYMAGKYKTHAQSDKLQHNVTKPQLKRLFERSKRRQDNTVFKKKTSDGKNYE